MMRVLGAHHPRRLYVILPSGRPGLQTLTIAEPERTTEVTPAGRAVVTPDPSGYKELTRGDAGGDMIRGRTARRTNLLFLGSM